MNKGFYGGVAITTNNGHDAEIPDFLATVGNVSAVGVSLPVSLPECCAPADRAAAFWMRANQAGGWHGASVEALDGSPGFEFRQP